MPIKRPRLNTGWMGQLAAEKRKKTNQELENMAILGAKIVRECHKQISQSLNLDYAYLPHPAMEHLLEIVEGECKKLAYTEENFWYVQKAIIHKAYGDPQVMQQSSGYKHHAIPYWNPTSSRVNIAPMGLTKGVDLKTKEAIPHDFVMPGERVFIPDGYTTGGKYSTVQGVAPQLRPLPMHVDTELDLEPLTYVEWCMFGKARYSTCCKKLVVWYEGGNRLACAKCGQVC